MSDEKLLRVSTAFGPSRDETLLLTVHPDEEHDRSGDPVPNRRTLILALKGGAATFVDERPNPLVRSWYSTTSGVAYCSSVCDDRIHTYHLGKWSEEVFSPSPVDFVRYIFGFGGIKPQDDQLFMSTTSGLFIRRNNVWTHFALDGEAFAYQIHGRLPTEVFIGGPTLWKWDGQSLAQLELPEDDTGAAAWVTADARVIVGSTYLSITDSDGGWERIVTPIKNFGVLTELGGIVYASASRGVMRVLPGGAALVSPRAEIDRLANVGDAIVAIGDDRCLVGDASSWQDVQLPKCRVGQRP